MNTNIRCNNCKLIKICKISDFISEYSSIADIKLNCCSLYQSNLDVSRQESAPLDSDNEVIEDISSSASISEELNNLFGIYDKQNKQDDTSNNIDTGDIGTGVCDKCGERFFETQLTTTLDGQTLCNKCYDESAPASILSLESIIKAK